MASRTAMLAFAVLAGCSAPPPPAAEPPAPSSGAPAAAASSAPAASAAVPSPAPAGTSEAEAEAVPSAALVTATLVRGATAYPDPLTLVSQPPATPVPFFQGRILWANRYSSPADGSAPFMVLLCERTCDINYPLPPVSAPPGPALSPDIMLAIGGVIERPLGAERIVTLRTLGAGLGGAMVTARWKSPRGRFELAAVLFVSPKDITVSKAARAYLAAGELTRTLEALSQAADRALWPPK